MPEITPILEVTSLCRRFPDQDPPALTDISFSVDRGIFLVISGANGSGKSVLMNLIAGLDKPSSGTVTIARENGKPVRIGLVLQDADAQILGDTPEEDVSFGPRNLGFDKKSCTEIAKRVLLQVGLAGREHVPARSLSGGEKRRLAVAGVLAMNAGIIIFDEPFANLDWTGVIQVVSILEKLKADAKTIILLTHELEKVLALADKLMILCRGTLVFLGLPEDALTSAPLANWGIRNPLRNYQSPKDLVWKDVP